MAGKLTSKTAIVTGAAQGIGAAIVRLFAQEDCFVYVTDINDDLGKAVADSLGDRASYLRLDVRRLRSARLGGRFARGSATEAAADPADLQARRESFQVALLLVGKID